MNNNQHNVVWEHRQAELWDRIFQVTQDVVSLAETLESNAGGSVLKEQMLKSAMAVGKYLVRATASNSSEDFQRYVEQSRLKAVETDYWLRMAYIIQQREDIQRDLSSIITQYSGIVDLLQKMIRHVHDKHDANQHRQMPKVNL